MPMPPTPVFTVEDVIDQMRDRYPHSRYNPFLESSVAVRAIINANLSVFQTVWDEVGDLNTQEPADELGVSFLTEIYQKTASAMIELVSAYLEGLGQQEQ